MRSFQSSSAGPPSPSAFSNSSYYVPPSRLDEPIIIHTPTDIRPPQPETLVPHQHSFFNLQNNSLLLSSQAKNYVTQAIQSSWSESTIKRYTGTIKQYIHFCDAERIPEHLRFPADEFVLCAFAVWANTRVVHLAAAFLLSRPGT